MAAAYPTSFAPPSPKPKYMPPSYPRRKLPRPKPMPWNPRPKPTPMPRYPLPRPLKPLAPVPAVKPPMPLPKIPFWVFRGARFLPYIGWGILGWELYQWWKGQPEVEGGWNMDGFALCCDTGSRPLNAFKVSKGASNTPLAPCSYAPKCGTILQVPSGLEGTTISDPGYPSRNCTQYYVALGPQVLGGSRMHFAQVWFKQDCSDPAAPLEIPSTPPQEPVPAPFFDPVPIPAWVPTVWPDYLPIGEPAPVPRPLPYELLPHVPPALGPVPLPGVPPELKPDDLPALDPETVHIRKPPEDDEKEGKNNPKKGSTQVAWLNKVAGNVINGYTEGDDLVYALYNALPWQLRRWRGRDGVWRDRDANTAARLARIYKEFGKVKVAAFVQNYAQNQRGDKIGGTIGKIGRDAISGNPYYRGAGGLQQGQRFTSGQWDEVVGELRKAYAEGIKPRDYYVWRPYVDGERVPFGEPDQQFAETPFGTRRSPYWDVPANAEWRRELVKGTRQKIPWLQHTYYKRVRPRRGTAEWWRKGSGDFTLQKRTAYASGR